ncbi:hypothetical protein TUBRATIS_21420 [Tubulinosema ratisbonensis]|uniref:Uncharacterized protein n=1 Tax=Tubulinosema ratisbonensis TaxID=291195 RepID=A0A437AJU1_9MICR|nr:hypothetical protein TUBRATIS_21420 [Tubulinosema ratisbonensis]
MFLVINVLLCTINLKEWIGKRNQTILTLKELHSFTWLEYLYLMTEASDLTSLNTKTGDLLSDYYLLCAKKKLKLECDLQPFSEKFEKLLSELSKNNQNVPEILAENHNSTEKYVTFELNILLCKALWWKIRCDDFFASKIRLNSYFVQEFLDLIKFSELIEKINLLLIQTATNNLIKTKNKLVSLLVDKQRLINFQKKIIKLLNLCLKIFHKNLEDYREERYELFSKFESMAIRLGTEMKKCEMICEKWYGIFYPIIWINVKCFEQKFKAHLRNLRKDLFFQGSDFHERSSVLYLIFRGSCYFLMNTKAFKRFKSKLDSRAKKYQEFMNLGYNTNGYTMQEKDLAIFEEYVKVLWVDFVSLKKMLLYSLYYFVAASAFFYFYYLRSSKPLVK